MKKQERANVVLDNLNKFYPNIPIPLKHKNVYELLIAVLLSAQCTDERVNKITPLLFKTANNPHDMAKVPVNKIYKIARLSNFFQIFANCTCWIIRRIYK